MINSNKLIDGNKTNLILNKIKQKINQFITGSKHNHHQNNKTYFQTNGSYWVSTLSNQLNINSITPKLQINYSYQKGQDDVTLRDRLEQGIASNNLAIGL